MMVIVMMVANAEDAIEADIPIISKGITVTEN